MGNVIKFTPAAAGARRIAERYRLLSAVSAFENRVSYRAKAEWWELRANALEIAPQAQMVSFWNWGARHHKTDQSP